MPVVSLMSVIDILILAFCLAAFLAIRDHHRRQGLSYPPGPRPLPLVGNLLDIPKEFSWLTYSQLSKKHGDVLSFRVFGQVIVVVNSLKANKDLERRGDIYSGRPVIPIFEMSKWGWNTAFSKYNEFWRLQRKAVDRGLRPASLAEYYPLMQTKAHGLLTQLLKNPDEFEAHLYYMTGSLILAIGYGYEARGLNDPKINDAKDLIQFASKCTLPGALLVNVLPFLRHIPEWLPWLSYKPLARYGYNIGQEAVNGPLEFVKEAMLNGTAQTSLALENLQETEKLEGPERKRTEEAVAGALASMYLAGTETMASLVLSFIVEAILRPEIQTMAQEELDAVTGRERLPTLEDRPRLPFVDAVCKEVCRCRPVLPLGIPHATREDDVYNGFFIPKGAVVAVNVWGIFHDPVTYPEPDSFKPERFIDPNGGLREDLVLAPLFGFGRRACPGKYLADSTMFIMIASILSVFDIRKSKGTDGGPDAYPFMGTAVCRPCPFTCSITPRDKKAEELILADSRVP